MRDRHGHPMYLGYGQPDSESVGKNEGNCLRTKKVKFYFLLLLLLFFSFIIPILTLASNKMINSKILCFSFFSSVIKKLNIETQIPLIAELCLAVGPC